MESLQHPLWKIEEIRHQLKIVDGKACPDKIITNATYLHSVFKKWVQGNIWISKDRIVYAGPELPASTDGAEVIDASGSIATFCILSSN